MVKFGYIINYVEDEDEEAALSPPFEKVGE